MIEIFQVLLENFLKIRNDIFELILLMMESLFFFNNPNYSLLPLTKNQRKKFTPEEDEKLRMLVEKQGAQKWDNIAREMPGRTGRQCRDRYKNYLIPGYFNGQWSAEEDNLLRTKFLEFGSQWSKLTKFFNNRSANALKNRWNYFVSRQGSNEMVARSNISCLSSPEKVEMSETFIGEKGAESERNKKSRDTDKIDIPQNKSDKNLESTDVLESYFPDYEIFVNGKEEMEIQLYSMMSMNYGEIAEYELGF
ncbi:Myb-like DNA-binding domain containing protein [Tritrichomonas foetus]|uniref:Myb-like DNA-binding domain containing protein n=1 Tax=Tritrichomonas foetus TaxID=1144522 RepID=A0A1J4JK29_9EUKA|nr:Myb-like DNA-binding domain containing protein [Tritrichomonas foetus]|eukprot:OHS98969.1 Myb-like DNA-binding domain containing protein [Tritrichomonas foetus]